MFDFLTGGGGFAPVLFYMVPPLLKKNQKAFLKKNQKEIFKKNQKAIFKKENLEKTKKR